MDNKKYSLINIFKNNKITISLTLLLVLLELASGLLFPLFIGYAINDLIAGTYTGLINLSFLTIASLVFGMLRRFYDSRVYGKIYINLATSLVESEQKKDKDVSVISARVSLLTEIVEFFENSFPEIINSFLGLIGVVIILLTMSFKISILCFVVMGFIVLVYGVTGQKNLTLNTEFNDTLETQVSVLSQSNPHVIKNYFKSITKTNIKLSDLETLNFGAILSVSLSVFIFSIFIATTGSNITYGAVFALLMYVYEFIERVTILPLYYQNYIRLSEISDRLSKID